MILGALIALIVWIVIFYWANQQKVRFGAVIEAALFGLAGSGIGLLLT